MAEIIVKQNFGDAGSGIPAAGEAGLRDILKALSDNQKALEATLLAVKNAADQATQNAVPAPALTIVTFE